MTDEKSQEKRENKVLYASKRREYCRQDPVALKEVRRKFRERYHKKKEKGLVKAIKYHTPRQQLQKKRKYWNENSKKYRTKKQCYKEIKTHTYCKCM